MEQNNNRIEAPPFELKPRRVISNLTADLVTFEPFNDRYFPVVAKPTLSGVDLSSWAESARKQIQATLLQHGAILFRGFEVRSVLDLERFIVATSEQPLAYLERSSPRALVSGHIYTSTEYPAKHAIFLHCENSYQRTWPLKIFFYCQLPAEEGGETPIADTRRILMRISHSDLEKFVRKKILYVRNFGSGIGLSWKEVFQTESQQEVERYCLSQGIDFTWSGADRLRIRQVREAVQTHPITGELVWFNHAVFFHISTLDSATRSVLQSSLPPEDFPNNTYYGDGAEIETEALDRLRAIYREETVSFPWRKGDILLLDNMLTAHGRAPYRGLRKILVGMTEEYSIY